jgi:hypothetical protein
MWHPLDIALGIGLGLGIAIGIGIGIDFSSFPAQLCRCPPSFSGHDLGHP